MKHVIILYIRNIMGTPERKIHAIPQGFSVCQVSSCMPPANLDCYHAGLVCIKLTPEAGNTSCYPAPPFPAGLSNIMRVHAQPKVINHCLMTSRAYSRHWAECAIMVVCAVGMHLPGQMQPPAAQGGMGQSNPTFAPNMVPVLQARPGSSTMGQPYRGQLGAGALPASSFMPIMQHQVHSTQADVPHMSSMQPLLQNGALISSNSGQQVQFGPAMPHFQQQQQAQQHHAQQQHMQQPVQFDRLSSNDQTRSGYQNGVAVVSQGQCASAQSL